MTNAEVYLLLLRPSGVPVAGEAAGLMFQGQIELDGLEWELHNQEEGRAADARNSTVRDAERKLERSQSAALRKRHADKDRQREVQRAKLERLREEGRINGERERFLEEWRTLSVKQRASLLPGQFGQLDRDANARQEASAKFDARIKGIEGEYGRKVDEIDGVTHAGSFGEERDALRGKLREEEYEELERNKNFEVRFEKRVDLATTQMLNSMKAGDIFPMGTITLLQRSVNHFMTLVFNLRKVRLLNYELSADVSDTMTHVVERWTAEFGEMDWAYQNRGNIDGLGASPATGVKLATQGTARAFTMKKLGAPL